MSLVRMILTIAAMAVPSHADSQSVPAPTAHTLPADRHQQVDAIFAPWATTDTPGCALGITSNGTLDLSKGYGLANLEHGVSITPQTVFHAASMSKQFTAFAIGLLAQDGKLSLQDDVRRHLRELPDYGRTITINHLIHHTSGLRDQGQILGLAGWRTDDVYTQADVLWALTRQSRTNFEPGSEIVYGNSAYTLLAEIVQRASGLSFAAFTRERIFTPLAMNDTRFRDNHNDISRGRASAYARQPDGSWRISQPNFDHVGSTGLQTTVADMLTWQSNLLSGEVGGRALSAWMQTSGTLNDGTAITYGGGLRLAGYRGLRQVGHDGQDGGYRAQAVLFPDQRLAIVALCNGSPIDPNRLVDAVANVYLGDQMGTPALAPAIVPRQTGHSLSLLAGTYWSPLTDEIVRLEWNDGALRQTGASGALVATGTDLFRPADQPHEWRFVRAGGAPDGVAVELRIKDSWPTARVFTPIDEPLPTDAALAALTGSYHSQDTAMTYQVTLVAGKLILSWPRQNTVELTPVGGDRFVGSRGTVTFLRDASGAVRGWTLSNRRLRRLEAVRVTGRAPGQD